MIKNQPHLGLTLIELLLVLGILSIIGVFLSRDATQVLSQSYFPNTVERLVRTLRTAQAYAISGRGDSSWGVHLEDQTLTMFKGTDFGARDPAFDAETPIPSPVTLSGWTDLYFDKLRGLPSATPNILVEVLGRSGVISVGAEGAINRP